MSIRPPQESHGARAEGYGIVELKPTWNPRAGVSSEATFENLTRALNLPGCAVCRLVARRGDAFLASYCYEHVNDVGLRESIRDARGFCQRHAHDLLDKLDTLAVAITYRDILNTLVRELETLSDDGAPARRLGRFWRPNGRGNLRAPASCPACTAEAAAGTRALDGLAEWLTDPRMAAALAQGDPLCLEHLRGVLDRADASPELLARQRDGWRQLRDHLREIMRKSDHNFRTEELTPAERESIQAAVEAVIGFSRRPADDANEELQKLRHGGTNAQRSERHSQ